MPLRALMNSREILAPFFTQDEWNELIETVSSHKSSLILPCCGGQGYPKTNSLNTQYFAHCDGSITTCRWVNENSVLVAIKSEMAIACKNAGYSVSTEMTGNEWFAEILASRGSAKIALQIEGDTPPKIEMQTRQESYKRAGIRGAWFVKKIPSWYEDNEELPIFSLDARDNQLFVRLYRHLYSLRHFVEALLTKKVRFCPIIKSKQKQQVQIVFFAKQCWKCKKVSHVYYVSPPYSECNLEFGNDGTWTSDVYLFMPQILSAVRKLLSTDTGKNLRVGAIEKRYGRTVRRSYMSFGCSYCNALFGEFFIDEQKHFAPTLATFETDLFLEDPFVQEMPHWCYSQTEQFCCDKKG